MSIHKEGRTILFILLFILVGINILVYMILNLPDVWLWVISGISLVIFLFFLQFFRNPKVDIQEDPNVILAPADGKVVVIETAFEEEYLNEKRIQVSIFMSPLNVHVNRAPVSGTVTHFKYHSGKYLVAWHPKSSTENERTTTVVKMENGVEILFRQIAGAVARRILCYVDKGDQVSQGKEFGFIKFGSRVDLFLPLDAKIEVSHDTITKGGKTVIARLS